MRVRIGFGLSTASTTNDHASFAEMVDSLERLGFDSLWLAERVGAPTLDPVVGMTFAIARTHKLKVGMSVMVLPGRNPVLVAKQLASLDRLSDGRLLPAFGLGIADSAEQQAFGVERMERAGWFNEALPLIRRLWAEDGVTHRGERFQVEDVTVLPKPVQTPPEVWLGGAAPSELRRVGRMAEGWLPSFCTPDDVRSGIKVVSDHAAEAGRTIDPGHFGMLLGYTDGPIPERLARAVERRKPGVDPRDLVASGPDDLPDRLAEFIDAGASKFVVMPLAEPESWADHLDHLAELVLPMQQ